MYREEVFGKNEEDGEELEENKLHLCKHIGVSGRYNNCHSILGKVERKGGSQSVGLNTGDKMYPVQSTGFYPWLF